MAFVPPRVLIPPRVQLLPVSKGRREYDSLSLQGSDATSTDLEVGPKLDPSADSSPNIAREQEMPTSLSKDEGFQDVGGASAMPVLINVVVMPVQSSCLGPATQGDNGVDSLNPIIVEDEPVEGSPIADYDGPLCSSISVPSGKGEVLSGRRSPVFSLGESCGVSGFEGESSQPMLGNGSPVKRSILSRRTKGPSGDRKRYFEFCDPEEKGCCSSDSSDELYAPVQSKRKKRKTTRGRPCSSKPPSSRSPEIVYPRDLDGKQELMFFLVETKMCLVLKKHRKELERVSPGSGQFYQALRSLSPEARLRQQMRDLSLEDVKPQPASQPSLKDKLNMHPAVEINKLGAYPKKRFHLLVAAIGTLLEEKRRPGDSYAIRTWRGDITTVLSNLGKVLDSMI